ncbi:tripartite tricarboxylate transporter TctB family protein [Bacillus wiedmannii]|uniref:tripartite tricarboxylate transporter TctB family protein n=1 Tax=Bacillus wiedmannii TaxID=1890302 RepID=UPI003D96D290
MDILITILVFASISLLVYSLVQKIRKKPAMIWLKIATISFGFALITSGFSVGIRGGFTAIAFIIGAYSTVKLIIQFVKKQSGKLKTFIVFLIGFTTYIVLDYAIPYSTSVESSDGNVTSQKTPAVDEAKEESREPTHKQYSTEEIKSMFTIGMSIKEFEDKKEDSRIKVRNYNNYDPAGLYTFDTKDEQIVVVVLNAKEVTKVETLPDEASLGNFIKEEENRMNEEKRVAKEEADKKLKESYENNKQKLEGSGDSVTSKVNLKSGLAFFDFNHAGSRNFIVHLKDASGNDVGLLVNTIGSYKGKVSATIPASGEYYLEVKSSGNWNAAITQETPLVSESVPGTINGHGDDVVFINIPSGNHIVKLKHTGSRNFIIKVNDQNLLVNKIGTYEGSSSQVFKDSGMYSFGVKADGDWSITIE